MRYTLSIAIALAATVSVAAADPRPAGHVVQASGHRGFVDWTRGMVIATGAAPGDLRAPSPSIARVKARRIAGDRARLVLGRIAAELGRADGTDVADVLAKDPAARARLERVVARAREIDLQYGSDGSVVATLGLPIEAVRWALQPKPEAPRVGAGASAIVVDASALDLKPGLGLAIAVAAERYTGPTVFHFTKSRARADSRAGPRIASAVATGVRDGVLTLRGMNADALAAARKAGALVLVVLREKKP